MNKTDLAFFVVLCFCFAYIRDISVSLKKIHKILDYDFRQKTGIDDDF
jgi:hypothetical protein